MVVDFKSEILIPKGDVGDFAVVACDQFCSQPEYWQELRKQLKTDDSALDLILPECFLAQADERIEAIRMSCAKMLAGGRFDAVRGAVAVTRTTPFGRVRRGVVAAVNLDDYDYAQGSTALIRASERTIEQRIPPRVRIRRAIDVELPHIMLLVDDREGELSRAVQNAPKTPLYDGELKGGGGHVKGELISAADTAPLYDAVDRIIAASVKKFGTELFALVGDGNHSLATAKYCREHYPTADGYALVEIVDIYDEGLVCEPIHRLVQTDDPAAFVERLRAEVKGDAVTRIYTPTPIEINVPSDKVEAIVEIDRFCESYVERYGGSVEYVHGDDALCRKNHVGIRMRGLQKSELFDYVLKCGVLPKKTFSLGEAQEKRYYIEARRIQE